MLASEVPGVDGSGHQDEFDERQPLTTTTETTKQKETRKQRKEKLLKKRFAVFEFGKETVLEISFYYVFLLFYFIYIMIMNYEVILYVHLTICPGCRGVIGQLNFNYPAG